MNMKLIAIGSRIMGDDGAAIAVVESLYDELVGEGIEVIIGETDVEYCLRYINESEFIIILDAAISGRPWGTVWQLPLSNAINHCNKSQFQHDTDLLSTLKAREVALSGLLICIETADVTLKWGLSDALQRQLPRICQEVKEIILKFRGDLQYA